MQTSKLRPVFCLLINKNFTRNITVNNTVVKETEETIPQGKPWREIPSLPSLPIIGQLHHLLPGGFLYNLSSMEFMTKMNKTYGPITRFDPLFGAPPLIILFDAESSAQILRGENWMPERPGFLSLQYYRNSYKKNKSELAGLLTDHGEKWKKFRSMVNPAMLQPKTIKLYSETLDEVAQDMITSIRSIRFQTKSLEIHLNAYVQESNESI